MNQSASRSQRLYAAAKEIIPGGTQLLSKRPEQFAPGQWPAYYREAAGCTVVDLDGTRYTDLSYMGIGACVLGYADPDVTAAVVRRVQLGSMTTLNPPEEVELARLLLELHPWAEQTRFARTGGEAMAVAVRIARASTGRDTVAICGYHGWHDWYLAANLVPGDDHLAGHLLPGLEPAGVPKPLAGTAVTFRYNRLDELERIFAVQGGHLAAVVMEPTRSDDPAAGFLEGVKDLCRRHGARLVFDEITVGFKLAVGGAHLKYGVEPDLAVFAKSLGNGHPISAVIGRRETMQGAQSSFISSAYWTEGVGPAAAVATLKKLMQGDPIGQLAKIGRQLKENWAKLAARYKLPMNITGHDPLCGFAFDHPQAAALETLFTVRMLSAGFLATPRVHVSLAHRESDIAAYAAAADSVFAELAAAIANNDIESRIGGPVKQSGFARLT